MTSDQHLPTCRFCATPLRHLFVDLGMAPPCQSFLQPAQLREVEQFYPQDVYVCEQCLLVQLPAYVAPEDIFTEYAYFSSFSDSWLRHAETYCAMIAKRLDLGEQSMVVELASNDGYLLQYFVKQGIPALGVEPAANVAEAAVAKGVPTRVAFFGRKLAAELQAEGYAADLICGANVLAQVPDINDFVGGIKLLLKPGGTCTIEFPHLQRLIEQNQFDTIYHEHFSYFSLLSTEAIVAGHGLVVYDVEELKSHGGSLRVYMRHAENDALPVSDRVHALRAREEELGFRDVASYARFGAKVEATKRKLLRYLTEAKDAGKTIVAYGAAGKGNTLLNYCGIRTDFLACVVDRNPYKQGRYTPGTHIPVLPVEEIDTLKPDVILILPWNLAKEITQQMAHAADWGCEFVVPIPEVTVIRPETPGQS